MPRSKCSSGGLQFLPAVWYGHACALRIHHPPAPFTLTRHECGSWGSWKGCYQFSANSSNIRAILNSKNPLSFSSLLFFLLSFSETWGISPSLPQFHNHSLRRVMELDSRRREAATASAVRSQQESFADHCQSLPFFKIKGTQLSSGIFCHSLSNVRMRDYPRLVIIFRLFLALKLSPVLLPSFKMFLLHLLLRPPRCRWWKMYYLIVNIFSSPS